MRSSESSVYFEIKARALYVERVWQITILFFLFSLHVFIDWTDVQLKSYRTDEFIHKLYYETSRFYAFSHQWVIKARINGDHKDPTQSSERGISYQVIW